jgi:hypothetical protein
MKSEKVKVEEAQKRANVILRVQKGEITATEGAAELGVSRKTYYQWENRGLAALLRGVQEEEPGRPSLEVDTEKQALKAKVAELEKELNAAKQVAAVRAVLQDLAESRVRKEPSKKNSKPSKQPSK